MPKYRWIAKINIADIGDLSRYEIQRRKWFGWVETGIVWTGDLDGVIDYVRRLNEGSIDA